MDDIQEKVKDCSKVIGQKTRDGRKYFLENVLSQDNMDRLKEKASRVNEKIQKQKEKKEEEEEEEETPTTEPSGQSSSSSGSKPIKAPPPKPIARRRATPKPSPLPEEKTQSALVFNPTSLPPLIMPVPGPPLRAPATATNRTFLPVPVPVFVHDQPLPTASGNTTYPQPPQKQERQLSSHRLGDAHGFTQPPPTAVRRPRLPANQALATSPWPCQERLPDQYMNEDAYQMPGGVAPCYHSPKSRKARALCVEKRLKMLLKRELSNNKPIIVYSCCPDCRHGATSQNPPPRTSRASRKRPVRTRTHRQAHQHMQYVPTDNDLNQAKDQSIINQETVTEHISKCGVRSKKPIPPCMKCCLDFNDEPKKATKCRPNKHAGVKISNNTDCEGKGEKKTLQINITSKKRQGKRKGLCLNMDLDRLCSMIQSCHGRTADNGYSGNCHTRSSAQSFNTFSCPGGKTRIPPLRTDRCGYAGSQSYSERRTEPGYVKQISNQEKTTKLNNKCEEFGRTAVEKKLPPRSMTFVRPQTDAASLQQKSDDVTKSDGLKTNDHESTPDDERNPDPCSNIQDVMAELATIKENISSTKDRMQNLIRVPDTCKAALERDRFGDTGVLSSIPKKNSVVDRDWENKKWSGLNSSPISSKYRTLDKYTRACRTLHGDDNESSAWCVCSSDSDTYQKTSNNYLARMKYKYGSNNNCVRKGTLQPSMTLASSVAQGGRPVNLDRNGNRCLGDEGQRSSNHGTSLDDCPGGAKSESYSEMLNEDVCLSEDAPGMKTASIDYCTFGTWDNNPSSDCYWTKVYPEDRPDRLNTLDACNLIKDTLKNTEESDGFPPRLDMGLKSVSEYEKPNGVDVAKSSTCSSDEMHGGQKLHSFEEKLDSSSSLRSTDKQGYFSDTDTWVSSGASNKEAFNSVVKTLSSASTSRIFDSSLTSNTNKTSSDPFPSYLDNSSKGSSFSYPFTSMTSLSISNRNNKSTDMMNKLTKGHKNSSFKAMCCKSKQQTGDSSSALKKDNRPLSAPEAVGTNVNELFVFLSTSTQAPGERVETKTLVLGVVSEDQKAQPSLQAEKTPTVQPQPADPQNVNSAMVVIYTEENSPRHSNAIGLPGSRAKDVLPNISIQTDTTLPTRDEDMQAKSHFAKTTQAEKKTGRNRFTKKFPSVKAKSIWPRCNPRKNASGRKCNGHLENDKVQDGPGPNIEDAKMQENLISNKDTDSKVFSQAKEKDDNKTLNLLNFGKHKEISKISARSSITRKVKGALNRICSRKQNTSRKKKVDNSDSPSALDQSSSQPDHEQSIYTNDVHYYPFLNHKKDEDETCKKHSKCSSLKNSEMPMCNQINQTRDERAVGKEDVQTSDNGVGGREGECGVPRPEARPCQSSKSIDSTLSDISFSFSDDRVKDLCCSTNIEEKKQTMIDKEWSSQKSDNCTCGDKDNITITPTPSRRLISCSTADKPSDINEAKRSCKDTGQVSKCVSHVHELSQRRQLREKPSMEMDILAFPCFKCCKRGSNMARDTDCKHLVRDSIVTDAVVIETGKQNATTCQDNRMPNKTTSITGLKQCLLEEMYPSQNQKEPSGSLADSKHHRSISPKQEICERHKNMPSFNTDNTLDIGVSRTVTMDTFTNCQRNTGSGSDTKYCSPESKIEDTPRIKTERSRSSDITGHSCKHFSSKDNKKRPTLNYDIGLPNDFNGTCQIIGWDSKAKVLLEKPRKPIQQRVPCCTCSRVPGCSKYERHKALEVVEKPPETETMICAFPCFGCSNIGVDKAPEVVEKPPETETMICAFPCFGCSNIGVDNAHDTGPKVRIGDQGEKSKFHVTDVEDTGQQNEGTSPENQLSKTALSTVELQRCLKKVHGGLVQYPSEHELPERDSQRTARQTKERSVSSTVTKDKKSVSSNRKTKVVTEPIDYPNTRPLNKRTDVSTKISKEHGKHNTVNRLERGMGNTPNTTKLVQNPGENNKTLTEYLPEPNASNQDCKKSKTKTNHCSDGCTTTRPTCGNVFSKRASRIKWKPTMCPESKKRIFVKRNAKDTIDLECEEKTRQVQTGNPIEFTETNAFGGNSKGILEYLDKRVNGHALNYCFLCSMLCPQILVTSKASPENQNHGDSKIRDVGDGMKSDEADAKITNKDSRLDNPMGNYLVANEEQVHLRNEAAQDLQEHVRMLITSLPESLKPSGESNTCTRQAPTSVTPKPELIITKDTEDTIISSVLTQCFSDGTKNSSSKSQSSNNTTGTGLETPKQQFTSDEIIPHKHQENTESGTEKNPSIVANGGRSLVRALYNSQDQSAFQDGQECCMKWHEESTEKASDGRDCGNGQGYYPNGAPCFVCSRYSPDKEERLGTDTSYDYQYSSSSTISDQQLVSKSDVAGKKTIRNKDDVNVPCSVDDDHEWDNFITNFEPLECLQEETMRPIKECPVESHKTNKEIRFNVPRKESNDHCGRLPGSSSAASNPNQSSKNIDCEKTEGRDLCARVPECPPEPKEQKDDRPCIDREKREDSGCCVLPVCPSVSNEFTRESKCIDSEKKQCCDSKDYQRPCLNREDKHAKKSKGEEMPGTCPSHTEIDYCNERKTSNNETSRPKGSRQSISGNNTFCCEKPNEIQDRPCLTPEKRQSTFCKNDDVKQSVKPCKVERARKHEERKGCSSHNRQRENPKGHCRSVCSSDCEPSCAYVPDSGGSSIVSGCCQCADCSTPARRSVPLTRANCRCCRCCCQCKDRCQCRPNADRDAIYDLRSRELCQTIRKQTDNLFCFETCVDFSISRPTGYFDSCSYLDGRHGRPMNACPSPPCCCKNVHQSEHRSTKCQLYKMNKTKSKHKNTLEIVRQYCKCKCKCKKYRLNCNPCKKELSSGMNHQYTGSSKENDLKCCGFSPFFSVSSTNAHTSRSPSCTCMCYCDETLIDCLGKRSKYNSRNSNSSTFKAIKPPGSLRCKTEDLFTAIERRCSIKRNILQFTSNYCKGMEGRHQRKTK